MTYEHAWGDGVPNLRYLETIGAEIKNKSKVGPEMEYIPGCLDEGHLEKMRPKFDITFVIATLRTTIFVLLDILD